MKLLSNPATIATVAYADIFNFPLTEKELNYWLIFCKKPVISVKNIESEDGFYFLSGRGSLVRVRQKRTEEVGLKLGMAEKMAKLLRIIPTIQLVGLTGGLAMGNAEAGDDIDFFIISSAGVLWMTRLLATILMDLTGLRRHPEEREIGNSICLNMKFHDRILRRGRRRGCTGY